MTRYCPQCGQMWDPPFIGGARRCPACEQVTHQNPAVGVAVLIVREGEILLGRRARGPYAGRWCVPCGYVEWGEDVRAAARREFLEETGLEVDIGEVAAVHSNFHDPQRLTVGIWFHGRVRLGVLAPGDDLDEVGYFPLSDLPPLAFPTDHIVLRQLSGSGPRRA